MWPGLCCGIPLGGTAYPLVRSPARDAAIHVVLKRGCPRGECWRSPKLKLRGEVLGQERIGVRLAEAAQPAVERLEEAVWGSALVHADESGWWENAAGAIY